MSASSEVPVGEVVGSSEADGGRTTEGSMLNSIVGSGATAAAAEVVDSAEPKLD